MSTLRRQAAGDGLPSWDATDTFAIDGRDLVICPPVGDGGPVARSPSCAHRLTGLTAYTFARVEGFQRIAFDPTGDGRWLVWRTDGVKATYEPGVLTSRGVLEWRLSRVEDLSGNAVSYDWTTSQDAQVSVLKTIRYGDVEIRHLQSRNPSCRPAGRQCQ